MIKHHAKGNIQKSRRKGSFEVGIMIPIALTQFPRHHGSCRLTWGSSREITSWPTQKTKISLEMAPVYWNPKAYPSDTSPSKRPHLLIISKQVQPLETKILNIWAFETVLMLAAQKCCSRPIHTSPGVTTILVAEWELGRHVQNPYLQLSSFPLLWVLAYLAHTFQNDPHHSAIPRT